MYTLYVESERSGKGVVAGITGFDEYDILWSLAKKTPKNSRFVLCRNGSGVHRG